MSEGDGWTSPEPSSREAGQAAGTGQYGAPASAAAGPRTAWPSPALGQSPGYGPGQGPWWPRTALQPGIIPLRPLGVGEILDGAFTNIRRNLRATLGSAALITTLGQLVSGVLTFYALSRSMQEFARLQNGDTTGTTPVSSLASAGTSVLNLFISTVTVLILTGILTIIISRAALGQRITAGEAFRAARPRLLPLLGLGLLNLVIVLLPWAFATGLIVLAAFSHGAGLLVLLAVLAVLAAIPVSIWLWVKLSMSGAVLMLERSGIGASLSRSWRLVRRSWWRVFGIELLIAVLAGIIGAVLATPLQIVYFIEALSGHGGTRPTLIATLALSAGAILSGTVTNPINAGARALLYLDLRMRREGLDMALATAAGTEQVAGDEFASLWRPPADDARYREEPAPQYGPQYWSPAGYGWPAPPAPGYPAGGYPSGGLGPYQPPAGYPQPGGYPAGPGPGSGPAAEPSDWAPPDPGTGSGGPA